MASGNFLSIDLDEWTSNAGKRFINVSVFTGAESYFNLGLEHLTGTASAERYTLYLHLAYMLLYAKFNIFINYTIHAYV